MARIDLQGLRHSYLPNPSEDGDYALKQVDLVWDDGGAYALLGPSGCGKTTLLNLIAGFLAPTGDPVDDIHDQFFFGAGRLSGPDHQNLEETR